MTSRAELRWLNGGGHLWPEWYRKEARRRGNTDLAKCCGECQREVEGWKEAKPRPAEALDKTGQAR